MALTEAKGRYQGQAEVLARTAVPAIQEAEAVVDFWRRSRAHWFSKRPDFDRHFRERFLKLHLAAARRECDHWTHLPVGALALLILLDQFPRNAFRGTAHMYATDALARHFARVALERDQMDRVEVPLRLFFCLPFAHSEDLADQDVSVLLNARLGRTARSHAVRHRDIVRRFGRFPHRNPLLLRQTTPAEQEFLDGGGFAG
ncbi:DUF924 family protein [Cupriavidus consociatus]|uniref:DUF924 family protein n=1 Tax=Cupriavidus consociatus TaxID=2821357 RepID=UPI001AE16539|nr:MULTISPECIES: DUF924 family protein [unclassified Cupriavidus]MBP0620986.1 DUF924 family protein [Cupriavidus sp. LEh25]MDK2657656.1 DUF924 family protein [Cupriavidus sp. LEh21]